MRKPGLRGLAGAMIAIGVFVGALSMSSPLDEGPRELAVTDHVPLPCVDSPCEPGRPGLVDRVDTELVARIPQLDGFERRLLARTIVLESEAAQIDPLLVLALIEVESSYDLDATSGRGAKGLMQLRDATLQRELELHGLSGDPSDPAVNVQAGVRYLRRLLDAFGGEDLALMAYNAGPNRILGYLRDGGVPERFQVYPRRIRAELRRLRRLVPGAEPKLAVAEHPAPH